MLKGKKALVLGVANDRSLGWAIARDLHRQGCEIGFSFLGDALEKRVRPLATGIGSTFIEPLDVSNESQMDSFFNKAAEHFKGQIDILIHSIAFANREDLEGRFIDTSKEGFNTAMTISAYSLVAVAKRAEPLMKTNGGAIVTLSYYGAEKVIRNYNVMGVAKATLEACVRYLAVDLGPNKITVNAISAGPVKTLAASGVRDLRTMLTTAAEKTPLKETIQAEDVGALAGFLCGPGGKRITGSTMYVDSGAHIMGN